MTELNSFREKMIRKQRAVSAKFNACRENFEKRARLTKADLKEAGRIWNEVGEKFEWWNSLP